MAHASQLTFWKSKGEALTQQQDQHRIYQKARDFSSKMGIFNRFKKVRQEVAIDSETNTDGIEVMPASAVPNIRSRDRIAKLTEQHRPLTKREQKKLKKIEAKHFAERKAERSSRIQALISMRQSHLEEYHQ